MKRYHKHLHIDVRTVRGLLNDCKRAEGIPDPPGKLMKAFNRFEDRETSKALEKEAERLIKKFKQGKTEAEKMVVLKEVADIQKARASLKKYIKSLK